MRVRRDSPVGRRVFERAGGRCEYCRVAEADDYRPHQIEHVVARKHGGGGGADDLAVACRPCNLGKGPDLCGVDPATGGVVRLFDPRRQPWADHFRLNGGLVEGLTAAGRATALTLGMNDRHRCRVRRRSAPSEDAP